MANPQSEEVRNPTASPLSRDDKSLIDKRKGTTVCQPRQIKVLLTLDHRTHRERKEMYIKALEQEVLRLKETYGGVVRDRNSYEEENRRLRELLAQHNIAFPETHLNSMTSGDASSSGSISGSYAAGSSYTGGVSSPPLSHGQQGSPVTNRATAQKDFSTGIDYDQIGIDFVLT